MDRIKVGIVGATGYTGSELVRILLEHPNVEITVITADSRKGEMFVDVHPQFNSIFNTKLVGIDGLNEVELDIVFLALPHGISMDFVKDNTDKKYKIVDLSGDFRLSHPNVYEEWYHKEHVYPKGFNEAVYGIPELFRERIKKANLVANPGCYPTSSILPVAPLLKEGIVDDKNIIIDSKSGVTGAGNKPNMSTHFPNVNDNFSAYGIKNHRHTIEIQEIAAKYSGKKPVVQFTPHLLPVDRGILSTIYTKPQREVSDDFLSDVFQDFYKDEPFVRIVEKPPSIKQVRGSNYVDIFITYDERTDTIITVSVIDNLIKGAAGQAIQNMNLMMGIAEITGLSSAPIQP